jgi:hypothetical protein
MAFSEKTKDEVKRNAHFRCCVCRNYFVEVHHIIPEAHGGPDDIENAAPLCPNCHTNFGDNPTKRKVIRQMRDLWYELCEKSETNPDVTQFSTKLDGLYEEFNVVKDNQEKQNQALHELKVHLSDHFQKQVAQFATAATIEELMTASGSTTASIIKEPIGAFLSKQCPNCGSSISQTDAVFCPYCGTQL